MMQVAGHHSLTYKVKYWREYYLVKHIEKQFGGINIGDLNKVISYMHLKLQLRVNFNVRVLSNWYNTDSKLCRYGSRTTSG